MTLYDITIPISSELAVWPGDTSYKFDLGMAIRRGDSVNVGAVTMSVHTGTHVDAPFHFDDTAPGIDALPLDPYIGFAVVVDVRGLHSIGPEVWEGIDFARTPRVLLKTDSWSNYRVFPEAIPTLTEESAAYLAAQGALLFGIDVPSVDAIDSKTLPIHHTLNSANIRILESVDLRAVPPGIYELIALPLTFSGADGSPVRAILRTLPVE
ncbi:MAG: cyclase family protein [Armatimonadota bacterium]